MRMMNTLRGRKTPRGMKMSRNSCHSTRDELEMNGNLYVQPMEEAIRLG